MFEKGDLLTLSNEKEYIVINQINFDNKDYLFLVSKDGISNVAICLLENDTLSIVKDANTLEILLKKFTELKQQDVQYE